jgi:hypothetical protein
MAARTRTVVNIGPRRATAAFALAVCLGVCGPGSALAQSDVAQSLPDPNDDRPAERTEQSGGSGQGGLPQTGVFAAPVLAAALALLGAGVATRPARRRRRAYRCDVWWDEVTAPGRDPRAGGGDH